MKLEDLPWAAFFGDDPLPMVNDQGGESLGYGETEADALCDLAVKHGMELWNENED
jgi:hypothetical protein